MATGFVQRWNGKVSVRPGGIFQGGVASQATFLNAGAPVSGSSGTLAGIAPPYSQLIDTTTGAQYVNVGTLASPTWSSGSLSAVSNPITATGSTRAGAFVASTRINVVATAAAGTGVQLPASATTGIGGDTIVYNNGANAIKVYGAGSDTIDGVAGSTGVTLSGTAAASFRVLASSTIQSSLLGLKSA